MSVTGHCSGEDCPVAITRQRQAEMLAEVRASADAIIPDTLFIIELQELELKYLSADDRQQAEAAIARTRKSIRSLRLSQAALQATFDEFPETTDLVPHCPGKICEDVVDSSDKTYVLLKCGSTKLDKMMRERTMLIEQPPEAS